MNYKCRFCGYRFKDKYEQICPECLTAREEDISCGVFGEEEHSHHISAAELERESRLFSVNDTFKESRNEFLEDERRDEGRTSAARYEKMEQKQAAKQQKSYTRSNTSSVLPQQTVYSRQPYDPNQRVPSTLPNNANQQNPNGSKGCGCGCLIIFIIIILIAFGDKLGEIDFESLFSKNTETTTKTVNIEEFNMSDLSMPDIPEVPNLDSMTDVSSFFRDENYSPEIVSEDGTYSVRIKNWKLTEKGVKELTSDECACMNVSLPSEGTVKYSNDMGIDMNRYDFTVEIDSRNFENETHRLLYTITISQYTDSQVFYDYYTSVYDQPSTSDPEADVAIEIKDSKTVLCTNGDNKMLIIGVVKGDDPNNVEDFVFDIDDIGVYV